MTVTPPVKIVIDFLDGITQKKDASAYARGFIESHFDVPSLSGYYILPLGGGFVYEAHEGGSQRAYLPRILKMIKDNPSATISVRAGKRVLQISRGPKDSFNAVLLPEELSSYLENVIDPEDDGPRLIPYATPASVWMMTGAVIASLGALVFVLSLGFFIFDRLSDKPPQYDVMAASDLPMQQWHKIVSNVQPGGYVAALRFQNGSWISDIRTAEQAAKEREAEIKKQSETPAQPPAATGAAAAPNSPAPAAAAPALPAAQPDTQQPAAVQPPPAASAQAGSGSVPPPAAAVPAPPASGGNEDGGMALVPMGTP